MNEDAYARKVLTALDDSLADLRPDVLRRLRNAREQACELASQHASESRFRGMHSATLVDWIRQHRVGVIGILLATLVVLGGVMWQSSGNNEEDMADIDAGLLTGDLPVNAYLDNHLSKWADSSDSAN
ncbi:MAG: DUF3619 family protein [Betaproteobacteria bacterium]|nr:DUF3619 family protein [Betaproteobacteria bacterium]